MREALKRFAEAQEVILCRNDEKGSWKYCVNSYLLKRLKEETKELENALIDGDRDEIECECCDIANFAMMIFDNQRWK